MAETKRIKRVTKVFKPYHYHRNSSSYYLAKNYNEGGSLSSDSYFKLQKDEIFNILGRPKKIRVTITVIDD